MHCYSYGHIRIISSQLKRNSTSTCRHSLSSESELPFLFDSINFELGIESSVHIKHGANGRGLHADKGVKRGAKLMILPPNKGLFMSRSQLGEKDRLASIALQLMDHGDDNLRSYVDQLMPSSDEMTNLLMYREEERSLLQLPSLIKAAEEEEEWLLGSSPSNQVQSHFEGGWRRALALAASRTFAFKGKNSISVLPIGIDMANHSDGDPNADVYQDGDRLVMEASRAINQGEEILLNYGERSSLMMMRDYGFVIEGGSNQDRVDFDQWGLPPLNRRTLPPLNRQPLPPLNRQYLVVAAADRAFARFEGDKTRVHCALQSMLPYAADGDPRSHVIWTNQIDCFLSQFSSLEDDIASLTKDHDPSLSRRHTAAIKARIQLKSIYQMARTLLSS